MSDRVQMIALGLLAAVLLAAALFVVNDDADAKPLQTEAQVYDPFGTDDGRYAPILFERDHRLRVKARSRRFPVEHVKQGWR